MDMLTDIEITLSKLVPSDEPPIMTEEFLILPSGYGFAYSINKAGELTGLKLGAHVLTPDFFEWLYRQNSLRRLVLTSKNRDKLPKGISSLNHLELLWLHGFTHIPEDILLLNLEYVNDLEYSNLRELIKYKELFERSKRLSQESNIEKEESIQEKFLKEKLEERALAELILEKELNRKIIKSVRGIWIYPETMIDPPSEIIVRGINALHEYFRDRKDAEIGINEAKVLMVGHGGAGKTSLLKRMAGDKFDPNESQTHGINIRTLNRKLVDERHVTLKAWDFGGQEIMHATHQFFLSKRSVYILVLDGRKDEQAEYWLKHIEGFGGDSPILVVLNKSDENPGFDINRRFLKNKYPSIIGFVRLSCKTDRRIDEFEDILVEALRHVEIIHTRWPSNWLRVKAEIERLNVPFIGLLEYRRICEKAGVREASTQKTLAQFLNDLGVVVHFSDFVLKDTHVLNPWWLTGAVYKILKRGIDASSYNDIYLKLWPFPQTIRQQT